MSNTPNPARATLDQLRRQFLEQAAAAFDRMHSAASSGQAETRDQREPRARELGQQLIADLLQEECKSEAGFLQDIHAHPEDDTPRLIYADWLEDNHQPARAQLIRLQCRLARLGPEDPEYDLLHLQEQELLKEHGAAWMGHLPSWARKVAKFQRGFVNHLTMKTGYYLQIGKQLRQQVPFDSLHLNPLTQTAKLLDSGLLAGIRHLTLTGSDSELLLLLRSEKVFGLESLELHGRVSEEVCRALASSRHFGRLRRLTFWRSDLGPAHAAILSQAPLLGNLAELAGLDCRLGVEGVRLLSRSPHWAGQLKRLAFRGSGVGSWSSDYSEMGPEAARELVSSPMVKGLTSLDLGTCRIQGAVRDLARAPHLKDLVYLNLHGNEITDSGLEALGRTTQLPRLTSLSLGYNSIDPEGIAAFSQGPLLGQLQRLDLGCWWGGGAAGVKSLVESPACQQLRHLSLEECRLWPDAAAVLTASPYLSRLITLSLRYNDLGANGARVLAAATNMPALRYLNVSGNTLGSEGAEALAASPLGQQLHRLNLDRNSIPPAFRQQLETRFGRRVTV